MRDNSRSFTQGQRGRDFTEVIQPVIKLIKAWREEGVARTRSCYNVLSKMPSFPPTLQNT